LLPEFTRVDDLRHLYPGFGNIYKRYVEEAKFGVVKGPEFKFLKERLTFLRHLLKEHKELAPRNRTELIQALLSEGDLRHAQQVIPRSDKSKEAGTTSLFSRFTAVLSWSKGTDEESLRKEMRKMATGISDRDFLLELTGIEDEDLKATTQEAMVVAHTQLSSSIDATVNKMTHAVSRMQQEECNKGVQHEIETEQRKELSGALVNFIRDVNEHSIGRKAS